MLARPTKIGLFAAAALIGATATWLLWPAAAGPERPHVVVISIDTLRADHVGCYGFPKPTTPNMDALAADGVRFTNATAPVPLTLPSHASLLTGLIPPIHGVHKNENYQLAESNVTLAEMLSEAGYVTGAIVSTVILDGQFGLAQGFDTYDDTMPAVSAGAVGGQRRGDATSRRAAEWLSRHAEDDSFFLFLHYYDPHTKYDPPAPFAAQWADDLYAGEIAFVDRCVGEVIDHLKSLDLYDRTLIVVTSDHGEMLGEHGEATHGYFIYESAIKVPLIIKLPGRTPSRAAVESPVGLVDVTPTIGDFAGLPGQPVVSGRSLRAAMDGLAEPREERYLYCESVTPETFDANPLFGLAGARWKYIETTRSELYDIVADPGETANRIDAESGPARRLADRLHDVQARAYAVGAESHAASDSERRAQLESLGYVSSGNRADTMTIDPNRDDPKDIVAFQQDVQRAMKLLPAGRVEETIDILTRLVAQRPQAYMSRRLLIRSLDMMGRYAESLPHYDVLLEQDPDDADLLGQRARARMQTGDLAGARADCDRALAAQPERAEVWQTRGVIHLTLNDPQAAEADFTESLKRRPADVGALMNRGTARGNRGDLAGAIADYSEVIRLNPGVVQARVLRATARKDAGDLPGAIEDLQDCLLFIPPNAATQRDDIHALMTQFRTDP